MTIRLLDGQTRKKRALPGILTRDKLDLELHGGRSIDGVGTRIAQRLLALTAAVWHNRATKQPLTPSLIAYDH